MTLAERPVETFAALFEEHRPKVYAYMRGRLTDKEEAHDLTQTVFLRAWQAYDRYENRGQVGGWLMTIAYNELVKHIRSVRYANPIEEAAPILDPDPNPEEVALLNDRRAWARQSVELLQGDQRTVITLRFLEGKTHEEIACIMGKSNASVRVIQCRALGRLRKVVERDA